VSYYTAWCERLELQLKEHAGATALATTHSALRALINLHMSGHLYTFTDHAVKYELIVDALTDKSFMGGGASNHCYVAKNIHYYRDNVFTPHAILKFMDLTGGRLNYAGYELKCDIEHEAMALHDQLLFHGILPSRSMLRKLGAKVEKAVDEILLVECFQIEMGEGFRFTNVAKNIELVFKAKGKTCWR
jgi:hypothetical protein